MQGMHLKAEEILQTHLTTPAAHKQTNTSFHNNSSLSWILLTVTSPSMFSNKDGGIMIETD